MYLKSGAKAWIVLFTCAVYRAVHFELVKSLSTEAFIAALRRFIARRDQVSIIYSDNGTNFVGANNVMAELDWNEIQAASTVRRIDWKFNPPTAAWWGGWWERMVRMTKELLRRNLGRKSLNYEELMTVMCDVESVINSRPLTYVSEDEGDLVPLTPSMFIQSISNAEVVEFDHIDETSLRRRCRYLQKLRTCLRERFRKEYLAELVHRGDRKGSAINVGDVVLVGADNSKRVNWPMGKVLQVYPGKDDIARVARVKTERGEIIRPFQRLYPLEVSKGEARVWRRQGEEKTTTEAEPRSEENQHDETIFGSNEADRDECPKEESMTTRTGRVVKTPVKLDL